MKIVSLLLVALLLAPSVLPWAHAQAPGAPPAGRRSPRPMAWTTRGRNRSSASGNTFSIYQPQIEQWQGNQLQARAAVARRDGGVAAAALRRPLVLRAHRRGQGEPAGDPRGFFLREDRLPGDAGARQLEDVSFVKVDFPARRSAASTTRARAALAAHPDRAGPPAGQPRGHAGDRSATLRYRSRTPRPGSSTARAWPCSCSPTASRCSGRSRAPRSCGPSTRGSSSCSTPRAAAITCGS